MKHAILIMAHKHFENLCTLAKFFCKDCELFIHIDKKQTVPVEILGTLANYSYIKLISRKYDVNWGGTSVLDCELFLLRMAIENSEAEYFHLISGQDYPVRPLSYFLDYFSNNYGKEFIQFTKIPNPKWENGTFRRFQYFYPYDYASEKQQPKRWVHNEVQMQMRRGIKRPIPDDFEHLYGSSQWFSITRNAVTTLLEYTRLNPALYQKMWMTFAPEETYVATVIINLLGLDKIVPWNCRFIRWFNENGNRPANLGKEHFAYLLERDYLFARKIESPFSDDLLPLIDKYLLNDSVLIKSPTGGWIYDGFKHYQYEEAFFRIVAQLYHELNLKNAIDIGCGSGIYVKQWRGIGIPFAGYDANPYTPKLSSILLPTNDEPCRNVDITEDLSIVQPFDIVVCKDVLPYIPSPYIKNAITNLCKMSARFILLSWSVAEISNTISSINETELLSLFSERDFIIEPYLTSRVQIITKRTNCFMLIKKGAQLLDKKLNINTV